MLRPGTGAAPFLARAYTWMLVGPATSKYTPPKVMRGFLEAMVLVFRPWKPLYLPTCNGPKVLDGRGTGAGSLLGGTVGRRGTWI